MILGKAIIWAVCLTHITWGLTLLLSGIITRTTDISPVAALFNFNIYVTGLLFIVIGFLSLYGIYEKRFWHSLLATIPQQVVILFGLGSGIINVIYGHYSDGYTPEVAPHLFIFNDQAKSMFLAIFHTIAITQLYAPNYKTYLKNKKI